MGRLREIRRSQPQRLKEISAVRLRDNVGTVLLDLFYGEYDEVLVTYKGIPMGRILPFDK